MPQATQIVPKYLHSHVETYINDYTKFDDSASTPVDNNNKFICVFRSGKGPDNVLLKKDDLSDFIATYGNSNFAIIDVDVYHSRYVEELHISKLSTTIKNTNVK